MSKLFEIYLPGREYIIDWVGRTKRVCGIPHTHFQVCGNQKNKNLWYLVPHTFSLEFWEVYGTLKIRVCGTIT